EPNYLQAVVEIGNSARQGTFSKRQLKKMFNGRFNDRVGLYSPGIRGQFPDLQSFTNYLINLPTSREGIDAQILVDKNKLKLDRIHWIYLMDGLGKSIDEMYFIESDAQRAQIYDYILDWSELKPGSTVPINRIPRFLNAPRELAYFEGLVPPESFITK